MASQIKLQISNYITAYYNHYYCSCFTANAVIAGCSTDFYHQIFDESKLKTVMLPSAQGNEYTINL